MAMRNLIEHYEGYYGSPELAAWRDLGARDKAATIMGLTRELFPEAPRVADLGCGDGAVMAALSKQSFAREFVGFEISRSGVEAARARSYGVPVRIELYDGKRLPAETDEFDLALLSHVLEHVEDPRRLLTEAARIARRIFVEVPLELHARTPRDFEWTELGHINLFNPTLLRHLVQSVGLEVERECITTSSRAIQQCLRPGLRGDLRWLAKRGILRVSTRLATALLTYNGALVARQS